MSHSHPRNTVPFFVSPLLPCPYLKGRAERKLITELSGGGAQRLYDVLSRSGFRRSHAIAYAPACPHCAACLPARIEVENFLPSRNFRRVWARNGDLVASPRAARATREQFQLFSRYVASRHGDGDMATMNERDYGYLIEETPLDTELIEFRDPTHRLLAACLVDHLGDGLSAVYSFFDPDDAARSLGSFMILWLIEETRRLKLPYVYLGYYIAESRKMSYKARFAPLALLRDGEWRILNEG